MPHAVREDLRAAAGTGIDARLLHALDGLGYGELASLGEKGDLDHGEGLDMNLRIPYFESAHQVHEVLEGQVRMQAADDVELRHRFGQALAGCLPGLFERHGVGVRFALLAAEGAKPAAGDTDVGGIDVPVDVEVGKVAVHPLADQVSHPADGEDIAGAIERKAVVEAEALAVLHLARDGDQRRIVGLKAVARLRGLGRSVHRCILRRSDEI